MKRFVFLLLISFVAKANSAAQDPCAITWDPPILLSDTTYNAYSPKITLSGDDTMHITWENGNGTTRLPYSRSINGGNSFEIRRELLVDSLVYPGAASWIQITSSGKFVFVFFQGSNATYTPVRMLMSSNAGTTWSVPINISPDSAGEIRSAAICADTLAIVYSRRGVKQILRSSNGGQSWTTTTQGFNYYTRAALSPSVLHLATLDNVTGDTEYRRSSNIGDTWTQRTLISPFDSHGSLDPAIAADDSSVIAAWRDERVCGASVGCTVAGRRGIVGHDSTTWLPEQILTTAPLGYEPALSARKANFAAAWPMDHESVPYAQVRVLRDSSLCSPFDPAAIPTKGVIIVSVALSTKAVHVVWEASQAPSPSTFRIFYRRGRFIYTDVKEEPATPPPFARLQQNYPNPFNPTTKITFTLSSQERDVVRSYVTLKVFDLLGREVATLVDEKKAAGEYTSEWNAEGMPSGVYYYRLSTGNRVETKKAILIK